MSIFSRFFGLGSSSPAMSGIEGWDAKANAYRFDNETINKKNQRQYAKQLNALDEQIERAVLKSVWTARFNWSGEAVKDIYQGYIESVIYDCGFCVAVNFAGAPAFFPATITGWDMNWQPSEFALISQGDMANGKIVAREECVVIKELNAMAVISTQGWPVPAVLGQRKAALVADAGRAVETYINGLKSPTIIMGTDKDVLTAQSILEQKLTNSPYIITQGKKMPIDGKVEALIQNNTHNGNDLMSLINSKQQIFNEALAKLGIGAVSKTKNSYVSSEELDKQDSFVDLLSKTAKQNRERACEEMREKFGWDISVEENKEDEGEAGEEEKFKGGRKE